MGTKNNPPKFDCYAAADPDEPMFILLGRDPMAPMLVRIWAEMRRATGESEDKINEALKCADDLESWAKKLGKKTFVVNKALLRYSIICVAMNRKKGLVDL